MQHIRFKQKKSHLKGGQNKGLDFAFQMHIIATDLSIDKYLKNKKNRKLKIKMKIEKMAQNRGKVQIFFRRLIFRKKRKQ